MNAKRDYSYVLKTRDRVAREQFVGYDIESTVHTPGTKFVVPVVATFSTCDSSLSTLFELINKKAPELTKLINKEVTFDLDDVTMYTCIAIQVTPENYRNIYAVLLAVKEYDLILTAHWAAFDFMQMFSYAPFLQEIIADLYKNNQITCTKLRETLISIGVNRNHFDPRFNMKSPKYSLAMLAKEYLGITMDKGSYKLDNELIRTEHWRISFAFLSNIPINKWPKEAIEYSMLDTVYVALVAVYQTMREVQRTVDGDVVFRYNVIPDEYRQARAEFSLCIAAGTGFVRDDEKTVEFICNTVKKLKALTPFEEALGLRRSNKKVSFNSFKKYIADSEIDIKLEPDAAEYYEETVFPALEKAIATSKGKVGTGNKKVLCTLVLLMSEFYGVPPKLTSTGKNKLISGEVSAGSIPIKYVSSDEDSLNSIPCPVIMFIVQYRGASKLFTSYVPMLLARSILIADVNPLLETGRAAVIKPPLQTLPRKGGFRECLTAEEEEALNSTDFHVAELCSLGQVTFKAFGYSEMASVINNGIDPHCVMGAELLNMPLSEFVYIYKQGSSHPRYPEIDNARQVGKIGNFGVPGGLGPEAFVEMARKNYGVILTLEKAKIVINTFKNRFHEVKQLFAWVGKVTGKNQGSIVQLFSQRVRGGCTFTAACNTVFQGLTGDGAKAGCFEIVIRTFIKHEDTPNMFGARLLGFVHDETISKGPRKNLMWAMELAKVQEEVMMVFTPDVKSSCEPCCMINYSKKAKSVYDENGVIKIWEEAA